MLHGSKQKLMQVDKIEINRDNVIKMVQSQTLLGLLIHLTIDVVSLNITRRITLLKILSSYIDEKSMNTYIVTHMYYPCLIMAV